MTRLPLLTTQVQSERDVVAIRQQARRLAERLGFDGHDQARLGSAVSEIVRNAFIHAGGGRVQFALQTGAQPAAEVTVTDDGPGIADLDRVLSGGNGGMGLVAARRLVDGFRIDSKPGRGTTVTLLKSFTRRMRLPSRDQLAHLAADVVDTAPVDPFGELERRNRELIDTLQEVRRRQEELVALNRELEDTNRGVVALYSELDEKAERLREAHDLKTRFLSNISHEFRTPVNSILALSRMLLQRQDGDLNEEQQNQVFFIRQSAESLSELVNDLLDMAKIEAGKVGMRFERFTVAELFGALRGMLRPLVAVSDLHLAFEEGQHLPELHTDQGKVAQILRNLLSNALKFTERGQVRLTATSAEGGNAVAFAVSDTGIGIAPENLARIFDEFAQLDTPLHQVVKGTGLGLSLSRKLAGLLEGSLTVESRPGVGSTFTLTIPVVHSRAALPTEIEPPAETAPPPTGGVLVVDDDTASRYLLKKLLPEGLPVVEAADGATGMHLAKEAAPRLIFLDVVMPGIDGFQVLAALKNDPTTQAVPVIVCTSYSLSMQDRTRLAGAAAILAKSDLTAANVQAVVEGVLSGGDTC